MKQDEEVDYIIEAALATMKAKGATIVEVRYPKWLLDSMGEIYTTIRWPEFGPQIGAYLKTTGPKYPKSLAEMLERSKSIVSPRPDGAGPNNTRWILFERELASGSMDGYKYKSMHDHMMPLIRDIVDGIFADNKLDAYVYPTSNRRPGPIAEVPGGGGGGGYGGTNYANLTGYPDLIVPAGFTNDDLPVGISFFGPAFSEPKLLALGYAFEQASQARRLPINTPNLQGEMIEVPDKK
jgi:amidase